MDRKNTIEKNQNQEECSEMAIMSKKLIDLGRKARGRMEIFDHRAVMFGECKENNRNNE